MEHVFETIETDAGPGVVVDGTMAITGVTAQREEVVLCRDCAHSWKDGTSCNYFSDFDDGLIIPAIVEPDGFCAWASRREDGQCRTLR